MGWLVGLPLGLFRLLFAALRLALPLLVLLAVIVLVRRFLRQKNGPQTEDTRTKEPEFHGPVYTVDYEEVKDEPRDGEAPEEDDKGTWN